MIGESLETQAKRYIDYIYTELSAKMPRKGGIHRYSGDNTYRNTYLVKTNNGWQLIIGAGLSYSSLIFGFKDDGTRRTYPYPRIPKPTKDNPNPIALEAMNFRTIDYVLQKAAKFVALPTGGSVLLNGKPY